MNIKKYKKAVDDLIAEVQKDYDFKDSEYRKRLGNKDEIQKLAVNKMVKDKQEAINIIEKVDMLRLFGIFFHLNEEFECDFIKSQYKISFLSSSEEDAKNKLEEEKKAFNENEVIEIRSYERFNCIITDIYLKGHNTKAIITKYKDKYILNVGDIQLNNINIYSMIMNCDSNQAIKELCELLAIEIEEIERIRRKYNDNLRFLDELDKLDKKEYENLFQLLRKGKLNYFNNLGILINSGLDRLYVHNELYSNKDKVISIGNRKLAEISPQKKSSVNQIINVLSVLGFLEKIKKKDTDISYKSKEVNDISIYYIPEFNKYLLDIAEERAKRLLSIDKSIDGDEMIRVSDFTEKVCLIKFGEEITKKVYLKE